MTAPNSNRVPRRGERGYALLMVIFMAASVMLLATMASLSVKIQGQREKEEELAWRGNQYVRAIRLYKQKNNGRLPKSMEDLTAHHTDQPNFIRKAYKDPMNRADGSWRLIYVLPNGQLSGSVMHTQLQGVMPIAGPLGGAPTGLTPAITSGGATGQSPTFGPGAQQPTSTTQSGTSSSTDQSSNNSPVFGGSLIGVASKVKTPSMRVYKLGTTYYEWEFYYDPTAAPGLPGAATPPATPTGTQPPTTPGQPGTPGQPQGPGQSSTPQIDH